MATQTRRKPPPIAPGTASTFDFRAEIDLANIVSTGRRQTRDAFGVRQAAAIRAFMRRRMSATPIAAALPRAMGGDR
jgi:hypothetical protein